MKQATQKQVARSSLRRPRRLGVAEARRRLSEVLRDTVQGPTIIHSRGHDLAVLLAVEDYERLIAEFIAQPKAGAVFLQQIDALKKRRDGGVEEFEPQRLTLTPVDPFTSKLAAKR